MMGDLAAVLQRVQALESKGRTRSANARFGGDGGLVFVKPSPVASGSGATGWKRVNAARHVRSGARAALLTVSLRTGLASGDPFTEFAVQVRRSSSETARSLLKVGCSTDQLFTVQAVCPLSPSRGFELQITGAGSTPTEYAILVEGFWMPNV